MVYLVTDKDGRVIVSGDTVTDFRGETAVFEYVSRAPDIGKSAKVVVSGKLGEYYAGVFDLNVTVISD